MAPAYTNTMPRPGFVCFESKGKAEAKKPADTNNADNGNEYNSTLRDPSLMFAISIKGIAAKDRTSHTPA